LISTLSVYSVWNRCFGAWKGTKRAVRFGGRGGLAEPNWRFRSAVSDGRCFGAGFTTRESRLHAGFRRNGNNLRGVTLRRRANEIHSGFGFWGFQALVAFGRQGGSSLLGSKVGSSFRGRIASWLRLRSEGTTTQSFRTSLRRWRERLSRGDPPRALRLRSGSASTLRLRLMGAEGCSKHAFRSERGKRRRSKW